MNINLKNKACSLPNNKHGMPNFYLMNAEIQKRGRNKHRLAKVSGDNFPGGRGVRGKLQNFIQNGRSNFARKASHLF
jgi:hypothetical protein